MKINKILLFGVVAVLLYPTTYCVLRLTKYFVRQQFVTFGCPDHIREKYSDDAKPIKEGYISYSFESERNQIGCCRIQKKYIRFGEPILLPLFSPLREAEMRIRGFNTSRMQIWKGVAEFERYNSASNRVYFHRYSLVDEIVISRNEQKF